LGTTYGGDGMSSFALPDLQGRTPMHPGQGPGLSVHELGEVGGADTVTLLESQVPAHAHLARASTELADLQGPSLNRTMARSANATAYQSTVGPNPVAMAPEAIQPTGGDQPHNNLQPYLTLSFCIALQGIFPSRV
jgi:microcystin-dependent protein